MTESLRRQLAHDDAAWFMVEDILAWRKLRGKALEGQVRWVGFGEESDSWEPLEGLSKDVPVLVRDFCRAHVDDAGAAPLRALLRTIEDEA